LQIASRMRDTEKELALTDKHIRALQLRKERLRESITTRGQANEFEMRRWRSDAEMLADKQRRLHQRLSEDRSRMRRLDEIRDSTHTVQTRTELKQLARDARSKPTIKRHNLQHRSAKSRPRAS